MSSVVHHNTQTLKSVLQIAREGNLGPWTSRRGFDNLSSSEIVCNSSFLSTQVLQALKERWSRLTASDPDLIPPPGDAPFTASVDFEMEVHRWISDLHNVLNQIDNSLVSAPLIPKDQIHIALEWAEFIVDIIELLSTVWTSEWADVRGCPPLGSRISLLSEVDQNGNLTPLQESSAVWRAHWTESSSDGNACYCTRLADHLLNTLNTWIVAGQPADAVIPILTRVAPHLHFGYAWWVCGLPKDDAGSVFSIRPGLHPEMQKALACAASNDGLRRGMIHFTDPDALYTILETATGVGVVMQLIKAVCGGEDSYLKFRVISKVMSFDESRTEAMFSEPLPPRFYDMFLASWQHANQFKGSRQTEEVLFNTVNPFAKKLLDLVSPSTFSEWLRSLESGILDNSVADMWLPHLQLNHQISLIATKMEKGNCFLRVINELVSQLDPEAMRKTAGALYLLSFVDENYLAGELPQDVNEFMFRVLSMMHPGDYTCEKAMCRRALSYLDRSQLDQLISEAPLPQAKKLIQGVRDSRKTPLDTVEADVNVWSSPKFEDIQAAGEWITSSPRHFPAIQQILIGKSLAEVKAPLVNLFIEMLEDQLEAGQLEGIVKTVHDKTWVALAKAPSSANSPGAELIEALAHSENIAARNYASTKIMKLLAS